MKQRLDGASSAVVLDEMIVKITKRRQITLPSRLLNALAVGPGDSLDLQLVPGALMLRPRRVDCSLLAPLRFSLRKGRGTFDIDAFRQRRRKATLRD